MMRCLVCGKDTGPEILGCCEHCASGFLVDRTKVHPPHWSRHTMMSMICKICDRVISNEDYFNDQAKREAECIPQEAVDRLAAIIDDN